AMAGSDYTATTGTITFAPGETSKTISVAVLADAIVEANETFRLAISAPTNGTLAAASQATGTILDRPVSPPPTTGGAVTFTPKSSWNGGFVADVTIRNTSTTAMNGWTLEFDLAADITNLWSGTIVSRVGNHYVIRAASWNATIPPGGSITFGFQAAGLLAPPLNFKLNGATV
ncbi:MAG: cellulose binding domain-containing protein, partial [Planctomycetota bacterium]